MRDRSLARPSLASVPGSLAKNSPIFVMTIRISDHRIQHEKFRKGDFRPACSRGLDKGPIQGQKNVLEGMIPLAKFLSRIITDNLAGQELIAVK